MLALRIWYPMESLQELETGVPYNWGWDISALQECLQKYAGKLDS